MSSFEDDCPFYAYNFKYYLLHGKQYGNTLYLKGKINFDKVCKSCTLIVKPIAKNLYIKPKYSTTSMDIIKQEVENLLGEKVLSSEVVRMKGIYDCDEDYLKIQFAGELPNISNNSFADSNIEYIYGLKQNALHAFLLDKAIKGPCWIDVTIISFEQIVTCPTQLNCHPNDINLLESTTIPLLVPTLKVIALDVISVVNNRGILEPCFLATDIADCSNGTLHCKGFPLGFLQMAIFRTTLQQQFDIKLCSNWPTILFHFERFLKSQDFDIILCHDKSKLSNITEFYSLIQNYLIIDLKLASDEFYSSEVLNDLQSLFKYFLKENIDVPFEYYSLKDFNNGNANLQAAILSFTAPILKRVTKYIELANQMNIWSLYTLISNVTGCPLHEVASKPGQLERVEFMLKFELHNLMDSNRIVIPETTSPNRPKKQEILGGLVLEPNVGMYNDFVLVYDFKSLYPSIILEYSLSFTNDDNTLVNAMNTLISLRGKFERNEDDLTEIGFNFKLGKIHCKVIKLLANSIYGCLCSEHSIFYHPLLGNRITLYGRDLLNHSQELLRNEFDCIVIYGHTDSLFIHLHETYHSAHKKAIKFLNNFNKQYEYIAFELKGIYSNALIISKQRYALRTIYLEWVIKGVFKRTISKVCQDLFRRLLNSIIDSSNIILIKELHSAIKTMFKSDNLEDYLMHVQLQKSPETYSHLTRIGNVVKKWNLQSFNVYRKYDYVSYVMCNNPLSNRFHLKAYNSEEFIRLNKSSFALSIDKTYYKQETLKLFETALSSVPELVDIYDNIRKSLNVKLDSMKLHSVPKHCEMHGVVNFHFQCIHCNNYIILENITCGTFIICSYCSELLTSEEQMDSINDKISHNIKMFDTKLKKFEFLENECFGSWTEAVAQRKYNMIKQFCRQMKLWHEQIQLAIFILYWYSEKSNLVNEKEEVRRYLNKFATIILNCIKHLKSSN